LVPLPELAGEGTRDRGSRKGRRKACSARPLAANATITHADFAGAEFSAR
jgi:hypothetical protein